MADFSTHLNQWLDQDQPTLFEVVAQRELGQTLRPAFLHFLKVLCNHFPASRWPQVWRYSNEVFLALELLLQHHYLRGFGGSFAENFYSLRRVPRTCQSSSSSSPSSTAPSLSSTCCGASQSSCDTPLCRYHMLMSMFCLAFVPYLKQKLEDAYELLDSGQVSPEGQSQLRRICLRCFTVIYPYLHFAWEGLFFTFQLAYLLGKTSCFSPLLYLAGLQLKRLSEDDEKLFQQPGKSTQSNVIGSFGERWSMLLRVLLLPIRGAGQLVGLAASGLPALAFLLKFAEWWRSDEGTSSRRAARLTAKLPVPPPPVNGPRAIHRTSHPVLCPVCGQVRRNSTTLTVSGYVFCYTCLHAHITRHGCCPVSNIPASTDQMVRIFVPDG